MGIQVSATVKQIGKTTSEATARNHTCFIDRPEAKGGANRGPMGGELMLMGIGGCFMSTLLGAAIERGLDVSDVSVDVSATLETALPRFTDIVLRVNGGNADPAVLRELIAKAEAGCIAINTAKGATAVSVVLA